MNRAVLAENPSCNRACRVCHYKTFDYPHQLQKKQSWAIQQLGRWDSVLENICPAPEGERLAYRSKSWLRSSWKDGEVSFGMFRSIQVEGAWEKEFISWNTCPLHSVAIQQMIKKLQLLLGTDAPSFVQESLVGVWMGSPHCVLVFKDPVPDTLRSLNWSQILVPPFNRVWFHHNSQVGRKVFGHHPIQLMVGSHESDVNPLRAFRQVAQTLLVEARKIALKALLESSPSMVLDLYCGTGDFSLLLPPEMGWIGIEISKEAVTFANSLRPPEHHLAFAGAVEDRLRDPQVLSRIHNSYALYINPPRSGLTPEAQEQILNLIREKPPTTLVYLSCSASSLARDLEMFEDYGYCVTLLRPYDFFPQTEHFETLAVLLPGKELPKSESGIG